MESAANMGETLQTIGVILPDDLVPDDTTIVYKYRIPIRELDLNDESLEDARDGFRYVDLALAYYNGIHNTDYIAEGFPSVQSHFKNDGTVSSHCRFAAVPKSTAEGFESATTYFCSTLLRQQSGCEEVVTCCILDVLSTDCKECLLLGDPSVADKELSLSWTRGVSPVPEYSNDLAAGVTLSDKAKFRLRFALIALTYYNRKHRADYKFVDVLPYCMGRTRFVVHCNYIAKQNAPDASEKLFFAELAKRKDDEWFVVTCCVVSGQTRAGCHCCRPHGKRVIHPMRGFRFGLHPQDCFNPPRLRDRHR